jgi:hypothetical protein
MTKGQAGSTSITEGRISSVKTEYGPSEIQYDNGIQHTYCNQPEVGKVRIQPT